MNTTKPILVNVNDACRMLCISRPMIYKLLKAGQLKAVKLGSRTLFHVSVLQEYADSLPEMNEITDPTTNS